MLKFIRKVSSLPRIPIFDPKNVKFKYIEKGKIHPFPSNGVPPFITEYYSNNLNISPWHSLPIVNHEKSLETGIINYVCEIPKGLSNKFECSLELENNPIIQDTKKIIKNDREMIIPRYLSIPHPIDYGMIPKTWENPSAIAHGIDLPGDNDPIDVVELSFSDDGILQKSSKPRKVGEIIQARVLGALALIDENECDWKILVTSNLNLDLSSSLLSDSMIGELKEHFLTYKIPEGKPRNSYAFDGDIISISKTLEIISDCAIEYDNLINDDNWKNNNSGTGRVHSNTGFWSPLKE